MLATPVLRLAEHEVRAQPTPSAHLAGPRKNVPILMEEVSELAFLFSIKVAVDDELMLGKRSINLDFLRVL